MTRPASAQRSMVLTSATALGALLGVAALGTFGAAAGPLTATSIRVGPSISPYANNIGGGIGAHTDRVWGHPDGGTAGQDSNCIRRGDHRVDKHKPRRSCSDD
jgi:hypothetical protein